MGNRTDKVKRARDSIKVESWASPAREMYTTAIQRVEALTGTVHELTAVVTRAIESMEKREYARRLRNALIGTVAAGETDIEIRATPRPGTSWVIESIATTGNATGDLAVYLDEIQPWNLVDVDGNAGLNARHNLGWYVPDGREVIFHFFNQVAGDRVTVSLQIRSEA